MRYYVSQGSDKWWEPITSGITKALAETYAAHQARRYRGYPTVVFRVHRWDGAILSEHVTKCSRS